ncbi:MAG: hypothetical protein QOG46_809 [Pseudonocardiales bacterium]|nr:hypothetical protein [Pseudonocardiales bacterium]
MLTASRWRLMAWAAWDWGAASFYVVITSVVVLATALRLLSVCRSSVGNGGVCSGSRSFCWPDSSPSCRYGPATPQPAEGRLL